MPVWPREVSIPTCIRRGFFVARSTWLPKRLIAICIRSSSWPSTTNRRARRLHSEASIVSGEREILPLAAYQLPISEGIIDRRFVDLAVRLYVDALHRHPICSVLGRRLSCPVVKFLLAAKWKTVLVPFWFRIVHPNTFLQNIAVLRSSPVRRASLIFWMQRLGWGSSRRFRASRASIFIPPRDV